MGGSLGQATTMAQTGSRPYAGPIFNVPRRKGLVRLDPRTLLGLLVCTSVLAFLPKSDGVELALVVVFAIPMLLRGYVRMAVGYLVAYAALWSVLNIVFPHVGSVIATMFTISLTFARKVFLCAEVGTLLVRDNSVHRLTAAFYRLRIPRQVLIPLTVTLRYFPTLADEASHILDAIRLRDIPPSERLECFVVPLVMSATTTSDELSRAATCRGIENPAQPTDTERLRMAGADWAVLALGAAATVAAAVGGALL